jgi:zinc transport system substrate-binding protein
MISIKGSKFKILQLVGFGLEKSRRYLLSSQSFLSCSTQMLNQIYIVATALLLGVVSLAGCRQSPSVTSSPQTLQVMVSIPPQKYFVEQIGNGYVTVHVMLPPGAEPHTFEPKPEQLKQLSQSKAYLRIRIDFEDAWITKIKAANPRMLMVDTTQGIQRLPIASGFAEPASKSHTGEHEYLDPHVWLSPRLVKVQARTIYQTLVQLDAQHQPQYQANLERFLAEIDKLDAEIRQSLQTLKTRKFIVFHPGWGYFARDYQLEQVPIEVGGQEPSAAELAALIAQAQREQIQVVFAEPQFNKQSATTIAKEIGGEVLLIDPLSSDWLANLRRVSQTFAKVLSQTHRTQQWTRAIGAER